MATARKEHNLHFAQGTGVHLPANKIWWKNYNL